MTTPDNINVEEVLSHLISEVHNQVSDGETIRPDEVSHFTNLNIFHKEASAQLHKLLVAENQVTGDTSDGYHTFNELYHYRMLYNALYVNELIKNNPYAVHKSKRHSDGELAFGGGWFVVTMDLPTGQVTNHYELKDWDKFHCAELDKAPEWDGHTPQEAAKRMEAQLTQEEQLEGKDA